jgi:hypothetical protein
MNIDQAFYYSRLVACMNNRNALEAWRLALREFRLRLKAEEDCDLWAKIYHTETLETVRLHHEREKVNAARQAAVENSGRLARRLADANRRREQAFETLRETVDLLHVARQERDQARAAGFRLGLFNFGVWTLQAVAAWAIVLVVIA